MNELDMRRKLVETGDGSHSLYVPALDEQYHSRHGALQESQHVFIEMGLKCFGDGEEPLRILEIGFGTGLNALLTLVEPRGRPVRYTTVEAYPLSMEEAATLNYPSLLAVEAAADWFRWLHEAPWGMWASLAGQDFALYKWETMIEQMETGERFDLVYFDAFAPSKQPGLWTPEVFERMASLMSPGAVLVTYCAKGAVRRGMQAAGLEVERLPGPPGKREMLRARKVLEQK